MAVLLSITSFAQLNLYDNGPTNGTVDAWTINFGFVVSDSFTLVSDIPVSGVSFAAWLFPGDVLESAELSITSSEFGGTTYFDGIVQLTTSGCARNQLGFNVCTESAVFSDVPLNAGTYWLNLQNAVVNTGDPVYWDENSGPSSASSNSVGTIPSESFTLQNCMCGCSDRPDCGPPPPQTPEPGGLLLFGSGALAFFGACTLNKYFH